MTDISEQIKKNRESFEREARSVQQDPDLTPEAKARRLQPIFNEAKKVESQLRQQRRIDLANRANAAEQAVFSTPKPFGSDASLAAMSYRAALDSVERLDEPRQLSEKL